MASPSVAGGHVDDAQLHRLANEFEASLLAVALRSMTKSLGPMSELVAQQMALRVSSGMSDPLYLELKGQLG